MELDSVIVGGGDRSTKLQVSPQALASLPNFSLPGDISANDRYFRRDIVTNPFTLNSNSTLTVPDGPGHGAQVDEALLEEVTVERVCLRRNGRG